MADGETNIEIKRKEDEDDQENVQVTNLSQESEEVTAEEETQPVSINVDVTANPLPQDDPLKEEEVEVEVELEVTRDESALLEPAADLKRMTLAPEVQANAPLVTECDEATSVGNHLTLRVEVAANAAYLEENLTPFDGQDSPVLEDAKIVVHADADDQQHHSAEPPAVHQPELTTAKPPPQEATVEVPHPVAPPARASSSVAMILVPNEVSTPSVESHVSTSSHQLKPDAEPKKELLKKFNLSSAAQGSGDTCHVCHKRVYPTERIAANERIFHKICFRCTKCHGILSPRNFTFYNEELLCKPHYIERFKVAGRYNDPVAATSSTPGSETNHVAPRVVVSSAPIQTRAPVAPAPVTNKTGESVTKKEMSTTRNGTDYAESARDMWRKRDQRFSKSLNEIEVKRDDSSQPLQRKSSIPFNEPIVFASSGTVKDRMRMFENKAHQVGNENGPTTPNKFTKPFTGVKKVAFVPVERGNPEPANATQTPANDDDKPPVGLTKQRAALFEKH